MLAFLVIFLKSYFAFVISLFVGNICFSFFKTKSSSELLNTFFKLIMGIVFIVCSYSIIKSNFRTINLSVFVVLLTYLFLNWRTLQIPILKVAIHSFFNHSLIISTIVFTSCFLIWGLNLYDFENSLLKLFNYDYVFYSDLSKGLKSTGIENVKSLYYQFENPKKIYLYHYFDLWYNGFMSDLLNINSYISLIMVTYPILLSTFYIGIIGLFSLLSFKSYYWTIIILCPIAILLPFIDEFDFFRFAIRYNLFSPFSFKTLSNYIFILGSVISLIKNKYIEFILFNIICFLTYSTTIIALTPTIGIIIFSFFIFKKKLQLINIDIVRMVIIYSVSIASIFLIKTLIVDNSIANNLLKINYSFSTIRTLFLENIISTFISYSPVTIMTLYLAFKLLNHHTFKSYYILFLSFILSIIFSGFFTALFHGNANMRQSMNNIIPAITTCLYLYGLFIVIKCNLKHKSIISLLILIFSGHFILLISQKESTNLLNNYSMEYISKVVNCINNNKTSKISLIGGESKKKITGTKYYTWNKMASYLSYCKNISGSYDLSDLYCLDNGNQSNETITPLDSIEDYIHKNKVSHVIVDSTRIGLFKKTNKFELLYTDEKSKEGFFKVNIPILH